MRKNMTSVRLGYLALAFFLGGAIAMAQTITGSLRGTITDPSGAVVSGAAITAINVGTGIATQATSDGSGMYNISFLPIGYYKVQATAPGFETVSIGPIQLQIDQIVTTNAQLHIGKATTTVSVESGAEANLNVENSTLSTSIGSETLENMPLAAQNIAIAGLFVPGSINPNSSAMSGAMGTERDAYQGYGGAMDDQPSFNGNRQQSNSYILDGVDINETLQNSLGYNPSPYSIQEVHVITGNADAEFGNVNGGEIVMVTKGGTNGFHGSVFAYHEASGLTANTWSNKYSGTSRSLFNQNQFGAAVGGPVIKNKLFFFGNYEGLRYSNPPSEKLYSVPTAAERGLTPTAACPAGNADLSGVLEVDGIQLYDNTTAAGTTNPPAYVNNCVPITNPAAKYLFTTESEKVFPLPNRDPSPGTYTGGNYVGKIATTTANDQGDLRVDYTAGKADTFMFTYSYGDAWDTQNEVPMGVIFPYANNYPFLHAVGAWTRIVSQSIVNNFRAGYTRIVLNQGANTDPSGVFGLNGDNLLGIPLKNQSLAGFTWLDIGSGDISSIGSPVLPSEGTNLDNNFDYNDTLTWQHGKHVTKFGADLLRYQQDYASPGNLGGLLGQMTYSNGTYTNYGLADFIVDKASNIAIAGNTGLFGMRQWRDAVFVQDDWKVFPNLTVNLGLRYSYEQPNYEVNNKMVNVNIPKASFAPLGSSTDSLLSYAGQYNPATGKVNSRALFNPYRLGFMPRFGFALKVHPRIVIHAGYGTTDELESTGTGLRMTQNPPYLPSQSQSANAPDAGVPGTWFKAEDGFNPSSTFGTQFDAWDPKMRPAVIQQYSLTVQYQVTSHTIAQAGYVGQLGKHLAVPIALNQYTENLPGACDAACAVQIEPFYSLVGQGGSVIETASRAISNYNALQATLQHQQSNGLEYQINYTMGKAMTNNPGYFGVDGASVNDSFWQDINNPMGDYGPSSFDVRSNLSGTAVYALPVGRGKLIGKDWNRITDGIVGGWQLSGTTQINSGYPLSMTSSVNCSNNCPETVTDGTAHASQYRPMKIAGRGRLASGIFNWFGTDPSATPCASRGVDNGTCAYGRVYGFGNAHVGTERSPGFMNFDLSLVKSIQPFENHTLKIRVDAFNAFNIASYGNPYTRVTGNTASFGSITGTRSGPRQLQLALVYQF
jgi:hypothetical protein